MKIGKILPLKDYLSPNREEKINIAYSKINVNRFRDGNKAYHLCCGEGQLSVYIDPELANYLKKNTTTKSKWTKQTNETIDEEPILDLDETDQDNIDCGQKSLRRSNF